eukprot:1147622-Pelagomonas_calceolata.AAC.1
MQDAAPTTRTGGTGGSLPCTASGGPCLLCLSGVLIEGQQSDIRTEGLVPLWSVACNLLCLSASSEKSALRARGLFVSCICGRRGRDCAAWAGMRQLLRRGRSARMPNAKDAPTKGQAESCCTCRQRQHGCRRTDECGQRHDLVRQEIWPAAAAPPWVAEVHMNRRVGASEKECSRSPLGLKRMSSAPACRGTRDWMRRGVRQVVKQEELQSSGYKRTASAPNR